MAAPIPTEVTTRNGAIFIQRDGANTDLEYVGYHGLQGLSEDYGSSTRFFIFDKHGNYRTAGKTISPPADVGFSLTTGLRNVASTFDTLIGCDFNVYVAHSSCGKPSAFNQYQSVRLIRGARVNSEDGGNQVAFDTDERIQRTFTVAGEPPTIKAWKLNPEVMSTFNVMTSSGTFYSLAPCNGSICGQSKCQGTCGQTWAIISDGSQTGKVAIVDKNGAWKPKSKRPFQATAPTRVARVITCLDNGRLVAAQPTSNSAATSFSYSDDDGFNWTDNVSGVAATSTINGAIASIENTIVVATGGGYLYRSVDGGATWIAVEPGVITTNPYLGVQFVDEQTAYAIASDAVAQSIDGGASWFEITPPEASSMKDVWATNDFLWVAGTRLWYRAINGDDLTWYSRQIPLAYPISSAPITKIRFVNDYIGAVLQTGFIGGVGQVNRILYTVTGGAANTWRYYDLGTGDDGEGFFVPSTVLNDIQWCGSNTLYAAGDAAKSIKLSSF